MAKNSKRYNELLKNSKDLRLNGLKEIIDMIKKNSNSKFDESIDVSLRISLKQSKGGDFNLRTVTKLPTGTGKKVRVAVLCEADKIDEAKKYGADVVGSDELVEKISTGKFNFDKLICTPGMMGKIGKHGKVLGPKGLMPNPKLGTVSVDIKKSVQDIKEGLIEIKHDKDGNIGTSIGRKSFSTENLVNNLKHLVDFIKKEKSDTIKGDFIKNIFVTSTMGVSFKVNSKNI
jgi:large subunit ribosomal protein L1|tara:strand:+ start:640 stop:1332 length:693 start_codon:yes stop_codon:yes gene_type:complete